LCLEWLDAHPPKGLEVIDYGCGSGILAIAAALLGANHVEAVDHDPQALLATRDNAGKNHVEEKIRTLLPKQFEEKPADLILANILANPLIELAPRFAALLKPGGQIVLSGILDEQAETVMQRYREWFDLQPPGRLEEWVRIDGVRR
jgi:ribosomal protein L11 methyltransferase